MTKSFVGAALTLAFAVVVGLAAATSQEQEEEPTLYAASGRVTFKRYCASCHGKAADGNGILATMLKVEPSDLRFLSQENDGEFPVERVAEFIDGRRFVQAHGAREMPVWGEVLQTELRPDPEPEAADGEKRAARKIQELVLYLETIQLQEDPEPVE